MFFYIVWMKREEQGRWGDSEWQQGRRCNFFHFQERLKSTGYNIKLRILMSFVTNFRSKSPRATPLRLISAQYAAGSSGRLVTPSNSITCSFMQLKEKGAWPVSPAATRKPACLSPEKLHLYSPKITPSSKSDLCLKLQNCKQKISRIQEMLLGHTSPQKTSGQDQQRNKNLSGDGENLEKIHYKSAKTAVQSSSGSKSVSTEEGGEVGSYKWLKFNGQQEIFRVLRFINEGCYGKVYLVQHVPTNFVCCLKVIAKHQLTPQMKEQIAREVVIQSYLVHPNIVAIYGHSHDQDNVYLLLEACLGGNLFEKVQAAEGGLAEKEVANTVREACRALDYMHSNDIIHRDIKPQNILLHEGTVKICDFGWAVHSPLLRDTRCGTPVYLSPEVLRFDLYDSKVDVWSIGVLTYQLLFRRIPFDIKCIEDLAKIVSQEISFEGRQISADARGFILRCLSKHPRDRLTVEQALEHDFLLRENCRFRQTVN